MGAEVYEADFSDFATPGEYRLAVEGIGSSFPFVIDNNAYFEPFYNIVRGLYHQRSGIALEQPYTDYVRPAAPHNPNVTPGFAGKLQYTTFRFVDWENQDNSDKDKPAIEAGIQGPLDTYGWYQDAGDWDGYFSHLRIPSWLLFLYEFAPAKFPDNQLNLSEAVSLSGYEAFSFQLYGTGVTQVYVALDDADGNRVAESFQEVSIDGAWGTVIVDLPQDTALPPKLSPWRRGPSPP